MGSQGGCGVTGFRSQEGGRGFREQKLEAAQARKFIEQREAKRAAYYNYYTGKRWGAAESYDLCIDTSVLGLQATEILIADFVRKRFGL